MTFSLRQARNPWTRRRTPCGATEGRQARRGKATFSFEIHPSDSGLAGFSEWQGKQAVGIRDEGGRDWVSGQTCRRWFGGPDGESDGETASRHLSRCRRTRAPRSESFVGLAPLREDADDVTREPFSPAEVASMIKIAEGDWRGLIILAATTGLRLMDGARSSGAAWNSPRALYVRRRPKLARTLSCRFIRTSPNGLRLSREELPRRRFFPKRHQSR
jgi:hypothetical protein